MDYFAGIDVSLNRAACVVDTTGKIVREAKVASGREALVDWFGALDLPMARIGLEAGPLSQWLTSYARLWDQDEAMMMRREALSGRARVRREGSGATLRLGPLFELRPRLPLLVELDGEPFRVLEIEDGVLVAHSTICPHWLGPLDEAAPENGVPALPMARLSVRSANRRQRRRTRLPFGAGAACRRRSSYRRGIVAIGAERLNLYLIVLF
jgi:hypothetical protein